MSKDLKRRGFSFVGSTICYAFMQAVGMVNDHIVTASAGRRRGPLPDEGSAFRTGYRYQTEILQNMGCTRFWILYIFSP